MNLRLDALVIQFFDGLLNRSLIVRALRLHDGRRGNSEDEYSHEECWFHAGFSRE